MGDDGVVMSTTETYITTTSDINGTWINGTLWLNGTTAEPESSRVDAEWPKYLGMVLISFLLIFAVCSTFLTIKWYLDGGPNGKKID